MMVRLRVPHTLERLGPAVALAAPMLWLAFSGGGFFASTTALAAIGASVALLLWITLSLRPFEAVSPTATIAVGALAAFAVWTLSSAWWSDSAGRAMIEFDRALLYTLVVLLAALTSKTVQARRALLWGAGVAGVLVCGTGLVTRILPGIWSADPSIQADRLSYPVGYWNALGLISAITLVVLVHLSCSHREPRSIRILAASMWPVVAVALFFTFSRGALALVPVGVILYLLLGRPRAAIGALLAVIPTTTVALVAAYGADTLSTEAAGSAAGVDEGRTVALVLAGCILAAAAIRAAASPLDARVERVEVPAATRRRVVLVAVAVLVPLVVGGAVASGGVAAAKEQIERFTDEDYVSSGGDRRERLSQLGNNGRIPQWDASIEAFKDEPLHGTGAGTYALSWQRTRPYAYDVDDGHSLYAEVLGELGLAGLALLVLALGTLLTGVLRRLRGPDRQTAAAVAVVFVVWAVHAGIDWDWEMPVTTLPALVLAAAMTGRTATSRARGAAPEQFTRVVLGLACLGLAVTPALVWQSSEQLETATRAFRAGDCVTSAREAVASIETLAARAEPFVLAGYCNLRGGHLAAGERAMRSAVSRDPRNWETHYGLALALALRGQDPRPAARRALELNPRSAIARETVRSFATNEPRTWRRRATRARLPQ